MAQTTNTAIIVPARLASNRFPQKLLHRIKGDELIIHVARRIKSQAPEFPVYFAVDHPKLKDALARHGFDSLMTDMGHRNGTDRLAEANRQIGADFVVNIQGDEPLVTASQIRELARLVQNGSPMATLATVFVSSEDFMNPNNVKVVLDKDSKALYFSRAPLPYFQEASGKPDEDDLAHHLCYHHLGMYAYSSEFLQTFSALPPGRLEKLERLEQLRALENSYEIAVGITSDPSIGIDTLDDAKKFERLI